jgi:hypothetical protein
MVDAFAAVLKVAVRAELMPTFVAPLVGATEMTESGEVVLQLLVQVVPPPLPPPHPAITRVVATSHQAAGIRIINFSLESFSAGSP